tara:strand:+ start:1288 stop:1824 length:537 start_codon:yes stop_codon:yes gene_type:complete
LPRKVWTAGDVLAAADVNTYLGDQVISVFADAAARDTAIPTPIQGMVCYLQDTSILLVYGVSWTPVDTTASGLATLVVDATTARTLTSADSGKTIQFTSATAVTVTVDASTDIPVGGRVDIIADGAGAVTVTASVATVAGAATLTTSGSFTFGGQYSAATLLCVATDEYRLIGNVSVV